MPTRKQFVSSGLSGGFVLSLLLGLTSPRALAEETDSARKGIEEQYVQMQTLLTKHDITGYMKLLALPYTHRTLDGDTWNRATFEGALRDVYKPLPKNPPPATTPVPIPFSPGAQLKANLRGMVEKVTTQITRFQRKVDRVVDEQITIRDVAYPTPEGDMRSVRIINHSEDVWVRSDTAWLLQSRKDLKVNAKLFKTK